MFTWIISTKINMERIDTALLSRHLQEFDFRELFNLLGWGNPADSKPRQFQVDGETYTRRQIAQLSGVVIFEITTEDGRVPESPLRKKIQTEIDKIAHENLLIFLDAERTQSFWHWQKRERGKAETREHDYFRGQPTDLMMSKLVRMNVELKEFDDEGNAPPTVEIARKLAESLDVEKVTKKFYGGFEKQHEAFLEYITGITDERDRRWYASVILNRLMFIYFLQEKGFLDGAKPRYLQRKLDESKKRGANRYYSEFLHTLFFVGFAKPEEKRTKEERDLLGEIPYLNGGLFLPHRIEQEYKGKIEIADAAFENIFKLFQSFSWNLDDTPGGQADEINPDVLGYIFEKYINQKAFGAYYTRPEITQYLCEQTIHKLILDKVNALAEPAHGATPELFSSNSGTLFLTKNFGSMPDLLMSLDGYLCRVLWADILPSLKLLDPACGSGAFLVAAMKTMLNIYSAVIGKMELAGGALKDELDQIRAEHSLNYFIKRRIINDNLFGVDLMEEATEIAKLRLFMTLVSSVQRVEELEPLPNIDFNILAGNSLIGLLHVDAKDFDAHYGQGNLFRQSYKDIVAVRKNNIKNYRKATSETKDLQKFRDEIKQGDENAYEILNEILLEEFNRLGIKFEQTTWDAQKGKEGKPTKRAVTMQDIKDLHPFHWGYEFDEVLNERGGFDAIITNPPWESFKPNSKEFFESHELAISGGDNINGKPEKVFFKKKMTIKEFEDKRDEILKSNKEIRELWLEYLSRFPYVSLFYRNAKQFKNQISVVNGKKQGTDVNLYKLFLELCFNLLPQNGRCGIIVQAGVYTDLGTKQLREMLFNEGKINSLFGLSNEKFIFENVHHSIKFCILTFEKGGKTESFEAAFRMNPREAIKPNNLENFFRQKSEHIEIPISLIRRLSPDSGSVMEFKNKTDIHIAEKMLRFPLLGERLEDKWNLVLTREFDMTNDSHLFHTLNAKNRLPLYEGKMIHQFNPKFKEPSYWVDEAKARQALVGREEDKGQKLDYQNYRVGFRSVGENTNSRNFISTVIPQNVFCGNSLIVSKSLSENKFTLFIVAIFNSLLADYLIKKKISRNMNMFYVYQLPVPRLTEADAEFAPIVERAAKLIGIAPEFDELAKDVGLTGWQDGVTDETERAKLRAELDAMVAHLYNLTEDEFAYILTTFPLVAKETKEAALEMFRELTPTPDDETIAHLIAQDETRYTEFKVAACWNPVMAREERSMVNKVVEETASFMNSYEGGSIIIGVEDQTKNIIGLADDFRVADPRKGNEDGYKQFLQNSIGDKLGNNFLHLIKITFHNVSGKTVCRVHVEPAPEPVWYEEKLIIRAEVGKKTLTPQETTAYCGKRWN